MKLTLFISCLTFVLFSYKSNAQNLDWVKQIYPFDFDHHILSSDSYLNTANVICGDFRDSIYFGFSPGLQGEDNPTSDPMAFIVKTDYDGNHLWHHVLDEGIIRDTKIDHDGNVLVGLRHASSSMDIDPGPGTVEVSNGLGGNQHVLIKYSATGDYMWHKIMPVHWGYMQIEITSTNDVVVAGSFEQDFYFAGSQVACYGVRNTFILEVDETGTENWAIGIGGETNSSVSYSYIHTFDRDDSGNLYIVGKIEGTIDFDPSVLTTLMSSGSYSKIFLAKYSPTGDLVYVTEQGTTDNGTIQDLAVNSNGEAHITLEHAPTSSSDGGFKVRKCSASGTLDWEHIYLNTDLNTFAHAIECDELGNVYIAGKFREDSLDLDPTSGTDYMVFQDPSSNSSKGFLTKFNQSGQYQWSYHLDHQALYGSSQSPTNFNNLKMIEPNSMFLTNYRGGATLFKLAVNGNLNVAYNTVSQETLVLYPNPNDGEFSLRHDFGDTDAQIFSLSGQLIDTIHLTKSQSKIKVDLERGTYFLHVNNTIIKFMVR